MSRRKTIGGTAGKGGVNAAPVDQNMTVRVAAEQLLTVPIDELIPYANNARLHSKKQIAQIRASLREFGFVTPVLIDFDNNIIAGHGRVEAARAEGMTEVPCVLVSSLTEAQRKAYILTDNRLSETSEWDPQTLKIEMEGLEALEFDTTVVGFDAKALEEIHVNAYTRAKPGQSGQEEPPPFMEDDAERDLENSALCTVRRGDLYRLGRHRLMCGDCTSPQDVAALLDGTQPEYLLADPPYCSGGFQESKKISGSTGKKSKTLKIPNDTLSSRGYANLIRAAVSLAGEIRAAYIFTDWRMWVTLSDAVEASGLGVRNMLVWDKGAAGTGWGWRPQHELCMLASRTTWAGDPHKSDCGNVLAFARTKNKYHPTEKPLDLLRKIVNMTDFLRTVYDPFGGSGTTLLACEKEGASCWMMELDPRHAETALRRWEALTEQKAEKIN